MDTIVERRSAPRVAAADTRWGSRAILRPGHEIKLLDVGPGGVSILSNTRVLPGKRVELQLGASNDRCVAAGRVVRCRVIDLGPPIYEAAIALDQPLAHTNVNG
jgi:hypothetical protein